MILAGRCYDPANFAAPPSCEDLTKGLPLHMGKILECGAIAATPGSGRDCVLGTLTRDAFVLESLNPLRRFTCESAAAHTLYEKSDPYHLPGPGGVIHLDQVPFRDVGDGRVEVRGSRHERTVPYYVKVEGARLTGYRAISMAGCATRCSLLSCDTILAAVRAAGARRCSERREWPTVLPRVWTRRRDGAGRAGAATPRPRAGDPDRGRGARRRNRRIRWSA